MNVCLFNYQRLCKAYIPELVQPLIGAVEPLLGAVEPLIGAGEPLIGAGSAIDRGC